MRKALTAFFLIMIVDGAWATTQKLEEKPKTATRSQKKSPPDAKEKQQKTSNEANKNARQRDAEMESLIAEARNCPSEFTAEAMLRLAQSERITDKQWKRELLEDAFEYASGAQEPMKRLSDCRRSIGHSPGIYLTRVSNESGCFVAEMPGCQRDGCDR